MTEKGFERETRRWTVSGRVQGVGYRAFAALSARALGLAGGASNLPDGRVLVEGRGPAHALDRLESALWRGPRSSRVSAVVPEEAGDGREMTFDVEF